MPTTINKMYFMFHPTCWSQAVDANGQPPETVADKEAFMRCYEWEKKVIERQKAFFKTMKPDEMLFLFPIGTSPAMLSLQDAAFEALGDRCIIPTPTPIEADRNLTIDQYLDEPSLPDREKTFREVPPEIREELLSEMRAAREKLGSNWSMGIIKVIVYNRLCAAEALNVMKERGLEFDPETVECEAFGEGFEQCAMTWKSMMVHYMGIKHPALNIFDLSVTGQPFLATARIRDRILLDNEVVLYLWEGDGGKLIGFYARAWCKLADPQYFARINTKDMPMETWDITQRITPADGTPVRMEGETLVIPVYNAIRRDSTDRIVYVIANGANYDQCKKRLLEARIAP